MATQRHARHALPSRSTWSILRTQSQSELKRVERGLTIMPWAPVYVY